MNYYQNKVSLFSICYKILNLVIIISETWTSDPPFESLIAVSYNLSLLLYFHCEFLDHISLNVFYQEDTSEIVLYTFRCR